MEKNLSLVDDIKSRYEQLKLERNKFIDRWQEAEQYVAPVVYDWGNLDAVPSVPTRYASSPCLNLKTLVAGLTGYSISPNITWFKLSLQDQSTMDAYGVKDWLEECDKYLQAEYTRSNLYSEASKFVEYAAIDGHAAMLIDEDIERGKLRFTTMRNNEIYLDVDDYGEIDTVYREYYMTVRNAVKFFGLENLHESIQDKYKDVKLWNEKVKILYAVYPREGYDEESPDAKNMPYAAVYMDMDHSVIIQESGYNEMPFSVFEWDRISGLAYSNSPAITAMSDIKALNIIKSTSLKIAQMSAEPPMVLPSSIRNVNLVPRGRTYVDNPATDTITPIKTGDNYPITLDVKRDYEQEVRNWFFVDFFLMLQQKEAQMTATEVMELQGEKAATLANLVVALNEALTKIIKRSFNLLYQAGRLPELPEALMEEGASIKIEFIGPLAQAQQKYHAAGGITQALSLIGPIIQLDPTSADFIDFSKLMTRAMEGQGMPEEVIREDDDVQKIREARAKQQQAMMQQQQQQEMMQNLMSNAGQLGTKPQQGSIMDELNNQLRGGFNAGSLQ